MGRSELVEHSVVTPVVTTTGKITGYRIELWHTELNEHRLVRAPDTDILQNKVNTLLAQWNEKWERVSAKQQVVSTREKGKEQAEETTTDAQAALQEAESILGVALDVDDAVDWDALEDHLEFKTFNRAPYPRVTFNTQGKPTGFKSDAPPISPDSGSAKYQPKLNLLDKIFAARKSRKVAAANHLYAKDHQSWLGVKVEVEQSNAASKKNLRLPRLLTKKLRLLSRQPRSLPMPMFVN